MTKDDIIRMAREAGLVNWEATAYANELERFAALVASAAQAKEREVCAKLCDGISAVYNKPTDTAERIASQWCADVIRARGQA